MQAIIDTGQLLISAKQALPHGDFQRLFQDDKRLPFSQGTANRLMAIARDKRLSNSAHGPNLPASWRTLYELTKLDDDTFDTAIDNGAIRTDMQRRDIARLRPLPKQTARDPTFIFPIDVTDDEDLHYSENQNGMHIQMHCGDCIEHLSKLDAESVDIVVTSPPYNLGTAYHTYDDYQSRDDYLQWLQRWAQEIYRVLKPDGSLFLNLGSKPSDPWIPLQAAATVAGASTLAELDDSFRFKLQNTFHWIKSISIDTHDQNSKQNKTHSFGHYKPINSNIHVHDTHEYVFHFSKSDPVPLDRLALGVPYQDKSNLQRWESARDDLRCRGNCWFIPYETIQNRMNERPHPAAFPMQLAEWCIRVHGYHLATLVLDPFAGIGSTGVACIRLGVSFLGFELDPVYFAEAVKRLKTRDTMSQ